MKRTLRFLLAVSVSGLLISGCTDSRTQVAHPTYEATQPAQTVVSIQPARAREVVLVASRNSNKYHATYCGWAKRINGNNLLVFTSRNGAQNRGLIPCRVCRP